MRPDRLGALRSQVPSVCLPAIATVAAITAAPATTAAASTAAAMAAPSAAISTTASTATTAAALCLGTRFIHNEVSPAKILAVQGVDGAVRVFVVCDLDERETPRLSREPIANQIDAGRGDTDLRKPLVELIFRRGKRKITDIELLHLLTPSARNPLASRGAR
jgi:hypothetical protein